MWARLTRNWKWQLRAPCHLFPTPPYPDAAVKMPYSVHSTPGTVTPTAKRLDYWNVNVPESEWTRNCPEWLLTVDGRDREILETNDADYKRQSWARVQEIVSE